MRLNLNRINIAINALLLLATVLLPLLTYGQEEDMPDADRYISREIHQLERWQQKQLTAYKKLLKQVQAATDSIPAVTATGKEDVTDIKTGKRIDSLKQLYRYLEEHDWVEKTKAWGIDDQLTRLAAGQEQVGALKERISTLVEKLKASGNDRLYEKYIRKYGIARSKLQYWDGMLSEQDELEEAMIEYLRGTKGFDQAFRKNNTTNGNARSSSDYNHMSAEELERMGFQTKRQVKAQMQAEMGDAMEEIEQKMAADLQEVIDPGGKLGNSIRNGKEQLRGAVEQGKGALDKAAGAKESLNELPGSLKNTGAFRNPMRGIPFRYRFESLYNIRMTRAGIDGRPAMLDVSYALLFKLTQDLSYGAGAGLNIGLGKDWRHIKITFEGLNLQTFLDWKWQYGLSAQAGYERLMYPGAYADSTGTANDGIRNYFRSGRNMVYVGIMKRYRVSEKWNGTIFAGYDFLWRRHEMASPFIFKLGFSK